MVEDDIPMLHEWLNRPHFVEWWGGEAECPSLEETRAQYLPRVLAAERVTPYIAMLGNRPIGYAPLGLRFIWCGRDRDGFPLSRE